jgi:hypothetical protein
MSDKSKMPTVLLAYLERIGAEVLSFRRAMIKDHFGAYYHERTLIKINSDGTIHCSREEHCPTEEEAENIRVAVLASDFPKSVNATRALVERYLVGKDKELFFVLTDRRDNGIIMLQERVEPRDGRAKFFVPHSFWSDGEWRKLEPDGPLPFWKPAAEPMTHRGERTEARIMIHEGCKAARFIDRLVRDAVDHPWMEELKLYEHWGMIGGALAPHRTNYAELSREQPVEVVYVCDNDMMGMNALQKVSKYYGKAMKGITFDKSFPVSWDMADPMPTHLFSKTGRYIGPTLKQLLRPATRATEIIQEPGKKGRPAAFLREDFKKEWVHVVTPEVYIHKDWPDMMYAPDAFNNLVRPFSDIDETSRLVRRESSTKAVSVKYDPSKPPGIYGEGKRHVNTHVPSDVKAEKGDATPWVEFIERLIPDKGDLEELVRWCATLVCRSDIKMKYGVLLISETQGVGKGTLANIITPLVGGENVSTPSEHEIVDSQFNYWCAHKRLAVVHEIYAGHSSKAYDKLKSIVTDPDISVNQKMQPVYKINNWVHIFACSNSMRALKLSEDDRRWFVPLITDQKSEPSWWGEFNEWLKDGGLQIINWWLHDWLTSHEPVAPGEDAPWSSTKRAMIEEGYSEGQMLVAKTLDQIKEKMNGDPILVLDTDLQKLIKDQLYEGRQNDRLEKTATIRRIARQRGWHINKFPNHTFRPWGVSAFKAHLICSELAHSKTQWTDLKELGLSPTRPDPGPGEPGPRPDF